LQKLLELISTHRQRSGNHEYPAGFGNDLCGELEQVEGFPDTASWTVSPGLNPARLNLGWIELFSATRAITQWPVSDLPD